jgi:hypothetical protein
MNLKEIKKINAHNKALIKELNEFIGPEWKLTYKNEKNYMWGHSSRSVSISVEKRLYQSIKLPILFAEGEEMFTDKFLKDRLDIICKDAKGKVLQDFKKDYDRFFNIKIMYENISNVLNEDKVDTNNQKKKTAIRNKI